MLLRWMGLRLGAFFDGENGWLALVVSVTRVEKKSTKKTHTLDKHTGVFFKVKEKISLHLLGVKKKTVTDC